MKQTKHVPGHGRHEIRIREADEKRSIIKMVIRGKVDAKDTFGIQCLTTILSTLMKTTLLFLQEEQIFKPLQGGSWWTLLHIEAYCGHLMSATVQEGRATVKQQTVEP